MRITEPYTIFLRTLKSGRKVYYYQFRDDKGRRSACYSLGTSILSEAKRRALLLYRDGKMSKKVDMAFGPFAQGFFDYGSKYLESHEKAGRKLTDSTLQTYRIILDRYIIPYFEKVNLSSITDDDVENWVLSLSVSASTANTAQTIFSLVMKSAMKKRLIDRVPTAFRLKVSKKIRQLLSVNELKKIYHADWREDEKTLFLLLCTTGLRIGEALALSQDDLLPNYLHVRHSLHPQFGLGETKTKEARFVPCPLEIHPPFINNGRRITESSMIAQFKVICKSLEIDYTGRGLSLHSLRSFFITYMRSKGIPDAKIRGIVGHKDGTMTDWYTNWDATMFDDILTEQKELIKEITKE